MFNLQIYMTDILTIVLSQPIRDQAVSIHEQIERILSINEISYTRASFNSLQTLLPFSLLKPQENLRPFQDYSLVITIHYEKNLLTIRVSIYNENMMPIKVGSLPQKIFFLKYTLSLNQKDTDFQIKSNPITGEIELQSLFFIGSSVEVSECVYQCLNSIRDKSDIIYKVLEALEIIPSESEQNILFNKIMEKIQPLRSYITDSTNPELKGETTRQIQDKNAYFIQERRKISLAQSSNLNMVQKLKKNYIEENLNHFIHNSTKVKLSNFAYLALDSTPSLQKMLKAIECQDLLSHNDYRIEVFRSEGKEIQIEYKSLKTESINYQYSLVDKISRKKNYFTFLKEYIIARNYLQITNHYLLTKKYQEQFLTLNRYNEKNKMVLSLQTKMNIISQVISIGCICLERMENFQPSMGLANFIVDKHFNLKLNNIEKSEIDPRIELLQAIYWVLLNKRYFVIHEKEMKTMKFNSIETERLKFLGPAVVLKVFLKTLENYEKKVNTNNNIENLLLFVNRISETYSKVLNGHEDPIDCV